MDCSSEIKEPTQYLIDFLKGLISSIENKSLSDDELQLVGEFYMSYAFKTQVNDDSNSDKKHLGQADLMKFVAMGYYIYSNILKDSIVLSSDDEKDKDESESDESEEVSDGDSENDKNDGGTWSEVDTLIKNEK